MSADNWAVCPRCKQKRETATEVRAATLRKAYGKVSMDEYARLLSEPVGATELKETFREDYEIGVCAGKFFIDYNGECEACGFHIRFNHKQPALEAGS